MPGDSLPNASFYSAGVNRGVGRTQNGSPHCAEVWTSMEGSQKNVLENPNPPAQHPLRKWWHRRDTIFLNNILFIGKCLTYPPEKLKYLPYPLPTFHISTLPLR